MKFLLDVCVSSRSLDALLVALGHDVLSAVSVDPQASDDQLMEMALREDRVLITEDKAGQHNYALGRLSLGQET